MAFTFLLDFAKFLGKDQIDKKLEQKVVLVAIFPNDTSSIILIKILKHYYTQAEKWRVHIRHHYKRNNHAKKPSNPSNSSRYLLFIGNLFF